VKEGQSRHEVLLRLTHDVGKYVARAASNLPAGTIPSALIAMLVHDVYELRPGIRASEVFDEIAASAPGLATDLREVRASFDRIDVLETRVRASDEQAARIVAAIALQIRETLRSMVRGKHE